MHLSRLLALGVAAATLGLSGCATAVHFTSEPEGADVSYRGQVIGKTPFDYTVTDQFGWFSTYQFTARLDGFQPTVQEFHEKTPAEAQWILPRTIEFQLQK